MVVTFFAHAAHWTSVLIYLGPLAAVFAYAMFQRVRERRDEHEGGAPPGG